MLPASRLVLLSHFNIAELWVLRTQVGGGESHDESVLVRRGGGGFKPGKCIRISAI